MNKRIMMCFILEEWHFLVLVIKSKRSSEGYARNSNEWIEKQYLVEKESLELQ